MNISFLSSKFEQVKIIIQGKVNIFIVTETKLDGSFPLDKFFFFFYSKPDRLDRTRKGGGVITKNSLICQRTWFYKAFL